MYARLSFTILILSAVSGSAQDKPDTRAFTEAVVFAGGSFDPKGAPALGFAIGGGWGERFLVDFEFVHNKVNDGDAFGAPTLSFISNSSFKVSSVNFQMDLIRRSVARKTSPYATVGLSYIASRYTQPSRCFVPPSGCPPPTRQVEIDKLGFGFGTGLRFQLNRAIGLRLEVKLPRIGSNSENIGSELAVQTTLGIYFRN